MKVCEDGHEEIVHEGRTCPLCFEISEKDKLSRSVEKKQAEIQDLENRVEELEGELKAQGEKNP